MYVPIDIIATSKICHCCGLRTNAKFEAALNGMLLLQTQMHLLCFDETCGGPQSTNLEPIPAIS